MISPTRRLAADLHAAKVKTISRRWGVVAAVNSDRTCDITLGGSAVTLSHIGCVTPTVPAVGTSVLVDIYKRDIVVVGFAPLMQAGTVTISLSATSTSSTAVSFGWTFPTAPVVMVAANRGAANTTSFVANWASVTTTGFNARATTNDGTTTTDTVTVSWIAMAAG